MTDVKTTEWEGNKPGRRKKKGQWLRNVKEINQEKEEKKNLWTKDMIDVKTTEWEGNKPGRRRKKNLWTKDMTDVKTSTYLLWGGGGGGSPG